MLVIRLCIERASPDTGDVQGEGTIYQPKALLDGLKKHDVIVLDGLTYVVPPSGHV